MIQSNPVWQQREEQARFHARGVTLTLFVQGGCLLGVYIASALEHVCVGEANLPAEIFHSASDVLITHSF